MKLLSAAFWYSSHPKEAALIEAAREAPLEDVVALLTRLESTHGLNTRLWVLAVQLKGVFSGKVNAVAFTRQCWELMGLL